MNTRDDDKPASIGSVHAEVLGFARKLLGSQAVATLLLMGLAVLGYRALAADSRDAGSEAIKPVQSQVSALQAASEKRQLENAATHAELRANAEEMSKRMAAVERLSLETNLNVRLMLEARGLKPITLSAPPDGGVP